jgi:hypothetical protein
VNDFPVSPGNSQTQDQLPITTKAATFFSSHSMLRFPHRTGEVDRQLQ